MTDPRSVPRAMLSRRAALRLTAATLDRERITFKQTPYDVKARA